MSILAGSQKARFTGEKVIRVLSYGAVLWDTINRNRHIGGAPFNLAAHLAQCGVRASMISRVGNDELGRSALAELERLGVDRTFVGIDAKHPTGTVQVTLSSSGQPSYGITENVAWDFIQLDRQQKQALNKHQFNLFCFGTLEQRNEVSRKTLNDLLLRLDGIDVFYDVNLRQNYYSKQIIEKSLFHATILKLNNEEVRTLSLLLYERNLPDEEFARVVSAKYDVKVVLITRGENGCAVLYEGCFESYPGRKVRVVSTVGAGDAFSAAFLFEFYRGKPPVEAAWFANELGAFVASQWGAIPEYTEDIRQLLAR